MNIFSFSYITIRIPRQSRKAQVDIFVTRRVVCSAVLVHKLGLIRNKVLYQHSHPTRDVAISSTKTTN